MDLIEAPLREKIEEIIQEYGLSDTHVEIKEAVKGGYVGIPSKIIIEGKDKHGEEKTKHLFLKAAPRSEKLRNVMPLRDIFKNEIYLYSVVLPKFLKFQELKKVSFPFGGVARCYKTCITEGHEFLIFEDLAEKGYVLWDKTKPMTPDMIKFVFREIARYHAISFALKDQKPEEFKRITDKIPDMFADFLRTTDFSEFFVGNIERALKYFDPIKDKHIYSIFQNFVKNDVTKLLVDSGVPKDYVLIHGDSWCNNFMFRFEGGIDEGKIKDMKFLDWQGSRFSSPVIDLSYFFYSNGLQEAFDNLPVYLNVYYGALSSAIKELGSDPEVLFPYTTFEEHWRKYAKFGLIMACTTNTISHNHKDKIPDIVEIIEQDQSFDSCINGTEIINDPVCRDRTRKVVEHFVKNKLI